LDAALATSTYKVEGLQQESGDVDVNLAKGEKKELTFVFEDANRVQVRKKIVFDADYYETDLSLLVKRGDETIPQVKVAIGPSIGDQGVAHHTFYSVAPEGVAYVNGKLERHPPAGINSKSADKLVLNGPVDWAGVADTYFGMVAVPYKPTKDSNIERSPTNISRALAVRKRDS
jgi:YidC/Oxa1 family membrane protein insertase